MKKNMYIVIELFPEPYIVTDENGKVMYFDFMNEAFEEAQKCQKGMVVNVTAGRSC